MNITEYLNVNFSYKWAGLFSIEYASYCIRSKYMYLIFRDFNKWEKKSCDFLRLLDMFSEIIWLPIK